MEEILTVNSITAGKITKVTQTLQREDGSEARIVAYASFGCGLTPSIGVYVHRREGAGYNWRLCGDRSHPDWRKMSVEDYINRGRSEMLKTVSPCEILKMANAIGKPMSFFD